MIERGCTSFTYINEVFLERWAYFLHRSFDKNPSNEPEALAGRLNFLESVKDQSVVDTRELVGIHTDVL